MIWELVEGIRKLKDAPRNVEVDLIAGLTQRASWGRVWVESYKGRMEVSVWNNHGNQDHPRARRRGAGR